MVYFNAMPFFFNIVLNRVFFRFFFFFIFISLAMCFNYFYVDEELLFVLNEGECLRYEFEEKVEVSKAVKVSFPSNEVFFKCAKMLLFSFFVFSIIDCSGVKNYPCFEVSRHFTDIAHEHSLLVEQQRNTIFNEAGSFFFVVKKNVLTEHGFNLVSSEQNNVLPFFNNFVSFIGVQQPFSSILNFPFLKKCINDENVYHSVAPRLSAEQLKALWGLHAVGPVAGIIVKTNIEPQDPSQAYNYGKGVVGNWGENFFVEFNFCSFFPMDFIINSTSSVVGCLCLFTGLGCLNFFFAENITQPGVELPLLIDEGVPCSSFEIKNSVFYGIAGVTVGFRLALKAVQLVKYIFLLFGYVESFFFYTSSFSTGPIE